MYHRFPPEARGNCNCGTRDKNDPFNPVDSPWPIVSTIRLWSARVDSKKHLMVNLKLSLESSRTLPIQPLQESFPLSPRHVGDNFILWCVRKVFSLRIAWLVCELRKYLPYQPNQLNRNFFSRRTHWVLVIVVAKVCLANTCLWIACMYGWKYLPRLMKRFHLHHTFIGVVTSSVFFQFHEERSKKQNN